MFILKMKFVRTVAIWDVVVICNDQRCDLEELPEVLSQVSRSDRNVLLDLTRHFNWSSRKLKYKEILCLVSFEKEVKQMCDFTKLNFTQLSDHLPSVLWYQLLLTRLMKSSFVT